jgi:hypothetical protein
MTVEALKEAIAELPEDERHLLAAWLNEREFDAWDKKMVKDFSAGGRGMKLVDQVRSEVAKGHGLPFNAGRAQAKRD